MEMFIMSLTIFVLAIFVGVEVINKVPPTLHTPLMSGTNAISGIVVVGAIDATAPAAFGAEVDAVVGALDAVDRADDRRDGGFS